MRSLTLILALLLGTLATPRAIAQTLTKITFGTDWLAEAEHGGFYQALATGLYKKHGLDVTIRMGGPQNNPAQQVAAGVVDSPALLRQLRRPRHGRAGHSLSLPSPPSSKKTPRS